MNTKGLLELLHADNAAKAVKGVLLHGTGWIKLVGVLVLLSADVWLGAQVFMSRGMDWGTSYLVSIAVSAVQIALFENGAALIGKATGKWRLFIAYAALFIGWCVTILDSFVDALASLVKLGEGIPTTWHQIWANMSDPLVLIAFIIFFILSFLGERLARLVILGEFEEASASSGSPALAQSTSYVPPAGDQPIISANQSAAAPSQTKDWGEGPFPPPTECIDGDICTVNGKPYIFKFGAWMAAAAPKN